MVVESIAKLVEYQVHQDKKREKAEASQRQATKQAAELHIDLAREMGEHVKEMGAQVKLMSTQVDQRFEALAKAATPLPFGQQALHAAVEVAGIALGLWKQQLALEESENDNE